LTPIAAIRDRNGLTYPPPWLLSRPQVEKRYEVEHRRQPTARY
jgi:hypothetical protein